MTSPLAVVALIHPEFDNGDADLTIQSADGVQFKLKRAYLSATTGVFPGMEFEVGNEITYLTEHSTVLAILFRFTQPRKHPDLKGCTFNIVAAVAEAAEKYEVFSAMNICLLRIRMFLPNHAPEILSFAIMHDYSDLMSEAMPYLARSGLVETLQKLPPAWAAPWCRYYKTWDAIFDSVLNKVVALHLLEHQKKVSNRYERKERTCSREPNGIDIVCPACCVALIKWVLEVKKLGSLQLLQAACNDVRKLYDKEQTMREEVYGYRGSEDYMCNECIKTCMNISSVVGELKKEISSIPSFETFL